jgi:hypothetical protein
LQDNAWDAGIEVSWVPVRGSRIFASYTHEEGVRHINAANSTTTGLDVWTRDNNDTLVIGANTSIIPDRLDLKGTFTVMRYFGSLAQGQGPGNTSLVSSTAFPDVHTNFNRVDIVASYRFDKVQYAGLPMQPFVKLRYLWERNSTDDWQPLSWNYMYNFALQTSSTFAKGIMLGWDNPNYNVQAMMISAGVKW